MGLKQAGIASNHSPLASVEVKNEWSHPPPTIFLYKMQSDNFTVIADLSEQNSFRWHARPTPAAREIFQTHDVRLPFKMGTILKRCGELSTYSYLWQRVFKVVAGFVRIARANVIWWETCSARNKTNCGMLSSAKPRTVSVLSTCQYQLMEAYFSRNFACLLHGAAFFLRS